MFAMCLFFVTSSSSLAMDSNQEEKKVGNTEKSQCVICLEEVPKEKSYKTPCCKKEICAPHLYKWCQEKDDCPMCREKLSPETVLNTIIKKHPNVCLSCFDEQNPKDAAKFIMPWCGHTLCGRCVWKEDVGIIDSDCYCGVCEERHSIPEELTGNLLSWFYRNKTIDVRDLPGMDEDKRSDDQVVDWLCSLYKDRADVFIVPYNDLPGYFGLYTPPKVIGHLGRDVPIETVKRMMDEGLSNSIYDNKLDLGFDLYQYMSGYESCGDEKKYITINDPELAKKFIDAFHKMKKREMEEKKAEKEYAEWVDALSYDEPWGPGCNIF